MAPKRNSNYQAAAPNLVTAVLAHLVAVALITLLLVWLLHFQGGFAFESANKNKIFNFATFSLLGRTLASSPANACWVRLDTRGSNNGVQDSSGEEKDAENISVSSALVAGIVGIYAVFKFHNQKGIPNMYSLHSWLGITTITLFALQWLFSFVSFAYPGAQSSTRARLVPWHAVMGMIIFLMAILTAEIGLVEKFVFSHLQKGQEALIINFIGLLLFLFAVFVTLTVVL